MYGNTGLNPSLNSGHCIEARQAFNAMNNQPDSRNKNNLSKCIQRLKSNNIWDELDLLYFLNAYDTQGASINFKDPSRFNLTFHGGIVFTSGVGPKGNGTNAYINTNWNPSVNAVKWTLDSASIGLYIQNNVQESNQDLGCADANGQIQFISRSSADRRQCRINAATSGLSQLGDTLDSRGLTTFRRTGSPNTFILQGKNGQEIISVGAGSTTGIPNQNLTLLAYNNFGTPANFSNKQISLFFNGSKNIDIKVFYEIIQEYFTSQGINV